MEKEIAKIKEKISLLEKKLSMPQIEKEESFPSLCQQYKTLKNTLNLWESIKKIDQQIQELTPLLKDKELASLASQELKKLKKRKKQYQKKIKGEPESLINQIIIEVRAGTGGEEAALFAAQLLNVYLRFAQKKGWQVKLLSENRSQLGGYKEAVLEIKGKGAWNMLKDEAGVHRVQRVPKTEKSGRLHTSTVSLAVLNIPQKSEIEINPQELKIETFRASGHGGQNVQKVETAIRITHLPTNIVVTCQNERSQQQNKTTALNILKAKLQTIKNEQIKEKRTALRRTQIGHAKRAEKIRTYNFPQNRVTDHRLNKSWHNLNKVMEGDIEDIIKALKNK